MGLTSRCLVAALEGRLVRQQNAESFDDLVDETVADNILTEDLIQSPSGIPTPDDEAHSQGPFLGMKTVDSLTGLPETCISDLMQADLYVPQEFFS